MCNLCGSASPAPPTTSDQCLVPHCGHRRQCHIAQIDGQFDCKQHTRGAPNIRQLITIRLRHICQLAFHCFTESDNSCKGAFLRQIWDLSGHFVLSQPALLYCQPWPYPAVLAILMREHVGNWTMSSSCAPLQRGTTNQKRPPQLDPPVRSRRQCVLTEFFC